MSQESVPTTGGPDVLPNPVPETDPALPKPDPTPEPTPVPPLPEPAPTFSSLCGNYARLSVEGCRRFHQVGTLYLTKIAVKRQSMYASVQRSPRLHNRPKRIGFSHLEIWSM